MPLGCQRPATDRGAWIKRCRRDQRTEALRRKNQWVATNFPVEEQVMAWERRRGRCCCRKVK